MIREPRSFAAGAGVLVVTKIALTAFVVALFAAPALAQGRAQGQKPAPAPKPELVGTFGDWGAYTAQPAKQKTCYALTQPQERAPGNLKRDPAFVFITDRPGENVRNEVSIIMGFDVRPDSQPKAEVDGAEFALVAKGGNLWVRNAADEDKLVQAMRRGSRLTVQATSMRNNLTTDTYSLRGVTAALDRIRKECP
jgi:invasion protein IalB